MNKIWFKRKRYGWGWYPVTWQGWLTILIWLIVDLFIAYYVANYHLILKFVLIFVWVAILIYVCYKKGESPRWQWGNSKDK